jgi:hypothetical protein
LKIALTSMAAEANRPMKIFYSADLIAPGISVGLEALMMDLVG